MRASSTPQWVYIANRDCSLVVGCQLLPGAIVRTLIGLSARLVRRTDPLVRVRRRRVEMPRKQAIDSIRRLVWCPVACTLENLIRVWARDETLGESRCFRADRHVAVAPHVQR